MNDYWDQDNPYSTLSPDVNKTQADIPQESQAANKNAATTMGAAGAMTANPWLIGGAAALNVYSQYKERQQQERLAEYQSKLEKLKAMQSSLGNAMQMAGRINYT